MPTPGSTPGRLPLPAGGQASKGAPAARSSDLQPGCAAASGRTDQSAAASSTVRVLFRVIGQSRSRRLPARSEVASPILAQPGLSRGPARNIKRPIFGLRLDRMGPERSAHQALNCRSEALRPKPPLTLTTRGASGRGFLICCARLAGGKSRACRQSRPGSRSP